jgi:uncharacterized protein
MKAIVVTLWLSVAAAPWIMAQKDVCYPPKPASLVVDMVGILEPAEVRALESRLLQLNNETSNQVVVVVLNELCAGDAAMTAYEIGKRWGVGQKEFDNGVVILVKPTGGPGERRTFIATGYGLEGAIPDATAKLIVENEMLPHFRNNDYYGGLNAAITTIAELAAGEYSSADYAKRTQGNPAAALIPLFFVLVIWFLLFYRKTRNYSRNNNLGFWAALALMNAASRNHRGYYNNFRSGSGSFGGGFGGGGFGGFGGGRFGGGGAGGSW